MSTKQKIQQYEPTLDRFTGCLLGGALGDALGWAVEFSDLKEIKEIFGKSGILEPVPNAAGIYEITDDTQMVLFTAEGCLQA
jgi:ADP-ribosylglycohydrolase